MMHTFIVDYCYLVCTVVYIVLVLILGRFTLPYEQFRLTHFTGLINAPTGLFLYFMEDNYWNPPRLWGLKVGLEDLLISYAVAAVAWYTIALLWRRRLTLCYDWPGVAKRSLQIAGAGWLIYLAGVYAGADPMMSLLVTCGLAAVMIGWLRPDNWPLAATGMAVFPVVWFSICALTFWFLPESVLHWNVDGVWGTAILGVPVGEVAWAFVFGAFFPLLIGIVFNVRISGNAIRTDEQIWKKFRRAGLEGSNMHRTFFDHFKSGLRKKS